MTQRKASDWPNIRRVAIESAEKLTRKSASLPIDLGALARQRLVTKIEFRQLIVAGGISCVPEGFIIYVGCDGGEGDDLTERFEIDGTGAGLPPRIRARARFTIAHEIGHTFLYNIKSLPPRPSVNIKAPASLRSLEQTCNQVAGVLLVPEWLLFRDFQNSNLLDPCELQSLATKALISRETLVRRFSKLLEFPHPHGIIVALKKAASGLEIQAFSRHYRFADLLSESKSGMFLKQFIEHPDLLLNGGDFSEVEVSVSHAGGAKKCYVVRCEKTSVKANKIYFLTAALLE